MLNRTFWTAFVMVSCCIITTAQAVDFNKTEFFIGYSNGQIDAHRRSGGSIQGLFNDRTSFNGFEGSAVVNLTRFFGIKGDFSSTYRSRIINSNIALGSSTATLSASTKRSFYNLLGGVQVKDNASTSRLKPFAHVLVGVGHAREKYSNVNCIPVALCGLNNIVDSSFSASGLAAAFGGGLDIKFNNRIDFRAFQIDYNPMRFNGVTDHNLRLSVGLVIK